MTADRYEIKRVLGTFFFFFFFLKKKVIDRLSDLLSMAVQESVMPGNALMATGYEKSSEEVSTTTTFLHLGFLVTSGLWPIT